MNSSNEGLVERLRRGQWDNIFRQGPNNTGFCAPDCTEPREAADLIEAQATEIADLRRVLEGLCDAYANVADEHYLEAQGSWYSHARAALSQGKD